MVQQIKRVNLNDQITDCIIRNIQTGEWQLGEKIPNEIELANSFQVSRNMLREAMKVLEKQGVLISKTGQGTSVSDSALANIQSMVFFNTLRQNPSIEALLETRLIIEPDLAYYAALRATNKDIARLKKQLESFHIELEKNGYYGKDHFDFHLMIAELSGNRLCEEFLSVILKQLQASDYGKINNHVTQDFIEKSYAEHTKVYQAISKRDASKARELMAQQLSYRLAIVKPTYDMPITKK